jgi:hypothetical protein
MEERPMFNVYPQPTMFITTTEHTEARVSTREVLRSIQLYASKFTPFELRRLDQLVRYEGLLRAYHVQGTTPACRRHLLRAQRRAAKALLQA